MILNEKLFDKEGFVFKREKINHYNLTFSMENNNINLPKIIDFGLIKLIYDLNPDVYEKVNIEKINDNEITATILMKHLFEDLGLPQRYSYINMNKTIEDNKIIFKSHSIKDKKPLNMPQDSQLMSIENLICTCDVITEHKIHFSASIIFDKDMFVPPFVEKMFGMILHKIFKRIKQFIEKLSL